MTASSLKTVEPAIGVIEVATVARGLVCIDALGKRARVRLRWAEPVSPGKYVIVFWGNEADAWESLEAAREAAGPALVDSLYLPGVDARLERLVAEGGARYESGAVGVLEMTNVASTLLCADAALKAAHVEPLVLHLARGYGGRGYFAFSGEQDAVEAALETGDAMVVPELRAGRELIARPADEMRFAVDRLLAATRFG